MIAALAFRHLVQRPWRTVFLLLGYAMGVAVMVVLLSVGEAMLTQARDERLVGGGEITVLPDGIDVEVMKTGGLGGMFFSIDHARFVYRQLLAAPRLAAQVHAVAPQIVTKLVYLGLPDGSEFPARASGEIPSRNAAVGAASVLSAGAWADDEADRRWRAPTLAELRHEIDHFHLPPVEVANDPSWAEWHYFNVVSADRQRWAFISFIVAGQVPNGRWGAQVLVTLNGHGVAPRRFVSVAPPAAVEFSPDRPAHPDAPAASANVKIGESFVSVLPDGRYAVHAVAREEAGGAPLRVDLVVSPSPGAYFPGAALAGGELVSGYVVPALRADASGTICVSDHCERYDAAQSYHDHNWGVWRGVSWEWGAARAGEFALLFGRVEPADSAVARQPLFVFVTDSLGFLAVFRPRDIHYTDGRTILVDGHPVVVPVRGVLTDIRGDDSLRVELDVEDAMGTDTRRAQAERGDALAQRGIPRPYFIQMKGIAKISGRVNGRVLHGQGTGFFETYR